MNIPELAISLLINANTDGLQKAIGSIGDMFKGVGTTLLTAAGIDALSDGVMDAINAFSELQDKMALVDTMGMSDESGLGALKKQLIDISTTIPVTASELADAAYQGLSAGIAFDKVGEAAKLAGMAAKAGMSDTSTAIDGLTTVMNVWGESAGSMETIMDQFLTTQNLGKTTFGEMANTIGGAAAALSSAKITFQDTMGTVAHLTAAGVSTSEVFTGMKGVLAGLTNPTKAAAEMAQQLGIDYSITALKTKGWEGFLADLNTKLKDHVAKGGDANTAIAALNASQEAQKVYLGILGPQWENFTGKMGSYTNTAGTTNTMFEKVNNTFSSQWQILKNNLFPILEAVGSVIMSVLLPAVKEFNQFLRENVGPAIETIRSVFSDLISIIKDKAGAYLAPWIDKIKQVSDSFGILSDSVGGIKAIFETLFGKSSGDGILQGLEDFGNEVLELFDEVFDSIDISVWINTISTVFKNAISIIKSNLQMVIDWARKALDAITPVIKDIIEWVQDYILPSVVELSSIWENLYDIVRPFADFLVNTVIIAFKALWAIVSPIAEGLLAIGSALIWVTARAVEFTAGVMNRLGDLFDWIGGIYDDYIEPIINRISAAIGGTIDDVTKMFTAIGNFFQPFFTTIYDFIEPVVTYINQIYTYIVEDILGKINAVIDGVKKAWDWVTADDEDNKKEITITADDQASAKLLSVKEGLDDLDKSTSTPTIDADKSTAEQKTSQVDKSLKDLNNQTSKPKIDPDVEKFNEKMTGVETVISGMTKTISINPAVHRDLFDEQVKSLKSDLDKEKTEILKKLMYEPTVANEKALERVQELMSKLGELHKLGDTIIEPKLEIRKETIDDLKKSTDIAAGMVEESFRPVSGSIDSDLKLTFGDKLLGHLNNAGLNFKAWGEDIGKSLNQSLAGEFNNLFNGEGFDFGNILGTLKSNLFDKMSGLLSNAIIGPNGSGGIIGSISGMLGVSGPVGMAIVGAAAGIWSLFTSKMEDKTYHPKWDDVAKEMRTNFETEFNSVWDSFFDEGLDAVKAIFSVEGQTQEAIDDFTDYVKKQFESFGDAMGDSIKNANLESYLTEAFNLLATGIKGLKSSVGDIFSVDKLTGESSLAGGANYDALKLFFQNLKEQIATQAGTLKTSWELLLEPYRDILGPERYQAALNQIAQYSDGIVNQMTPTLEALWNEMLKHDPSEWGQLWIMYSNMLANSLTDTIDGMGTFEDFINIFLNNVETSAETASETAKDEKIGEEIGNQIGHNVAEGLSDGVADGMDQRNPLIPIRQAIEAGTDVWQRSLLNAYNSGKTLSEDGIGNLKNILQGLLDTGAVTVSDLVALYGAGVAELLGYTVSTAKNATEDISADVMDIVQNTQDAIDQIGQAAKDAAEAGIDTGPDIISVEDQITATKNAIAAIQVEYDNYYNQIDSRIDYQQSLIENKIQTELAGVNEVILAITSRYNLEMDFLNRQNDENLNLMDNYISSIQEMASLFEKAGDETFDMSAALEEANRIATAFNQDEIKHLESVNEANARVIDYKITTSELNESQKSALLDQLSSIKQMADAEDRQKAILELANQLKSAGIDINLQDYQIIKMKTDLTAEEITSMSEKAKLAEKAIKDMNEDLEIQRERLTAAGLPTLEIEREMALLKQEQLQQIADTLGISLDQLDVLDNQLLRTEEQKKANLELAQQQLNTLADELAAMEANGASQEDINTARLTALKAIAGNLGLEQSSLSGLLSQQEALKAEEAAKLSYQNAQLAALQGVNAATQGMKEALEGLESTLSELTRTLQTIANTDISSPARQMNDAISDAGSNAGTLQSTLRAINDMVITPTFAIPKDALESLDQASISPDVPSFDIGSDFIPYDMTANIHAGEKIIPAELNSQLAKMGIRTLNDVESLPRLMAAAMSQSQGGMMIEVNVSGNTFRDKNDIETMVELISEKMDEKLSHLVGVPS